MRIKRNIYNALLSFCPASPNEVGGILGSEKGVITTYIFDKGKSEYGKYMPNVNFINNMILLWNEQKITFSGMYHSHFPSGKNLSLSDKEYIRKIMISVGSIYNVLYFPIVIPKKEIISYKAEFELGKIDISSDPMFILD